ncbi:MAG: anthranilate phosphoribosyltransferase [Gammaproteobacteria bacterium]|nr:anthranilate phosphoribosyltransferase [Gammaproteobacteria bacterium]
MSDATVFCIRQAMEEVLMGQDLDEHRAAEVMEALTDDTVPAVLAGAFLTALRCKGETADEIRGFANTMRKLAIRPELPADSTAVDIVGTGGDGSGSLNISTGSALLAAASGLTVVKHGNRSVSSKSGSADVLEHLGMTLPADAEAVTQALADSGFTFLFAPYFHPAMKAVAPVRQVLAIRTVFNVLGPLTNPARPPFAVIGAYSEPLARLMADALSGMEVERAFVIHGEPGWDEATPVGPFVLFDVRDGQVRREVRDPKDYRMRRCTAADLQGGDAAYNADRLAAALSGKEQGAHVDALVLGAALALEVTGTTQSMRASMSHAREAINAGRGRALLASLKA